MSGPVERTARVVDNFAAEGLRTLVLAHKVIGEEELATFEREIEQARQSIVNRNKFVRDVYKAMEGGFTLIGATGIEDKLQVEKKFDHGLVFLLYRRISILFVY